MIRPALIPAALLLMLMLILGTPARAERVITSVSNTEIEVSSSFSGEKVTLFGNIEADPGVTDYPVSGPFHVVIVIEGPRQSRVARQMSNRWGIWSNTDQVVFESFPSYYHVLASGRLIDITDIVTLTELRILPEDMARQSAVAEWWKATVFGRELVRLMSARAQVGIDEQGVLFLSNTAFSARMTLPGNVANGPFVAHTYVFRGGMVIAEDVQGFTVRKVGFERFLGNAARQDPLLYGLVCVMLALGTGWLGGVVFRR